MTRFVDVSALCRIVNRVGADQILSGIAAAMRDDFRRWESFEKIARLASHSEIGVIELMPISDRHRYAFKYVNGHPANANKGVSTVMAFGALARRRGPGRRGGRARDVEVSERSRSSPGPPRYSAKPSSSSACAYRTYPVTIARFSRFTPKNNRLDRAASGSSV